jgi:two-component system, LuxR family, sensor kinase FixL
MTPDRDDRNLLQLISEGFILVDHEFRVVEMNSEAERIDQRSASEIVGHSLWQCWPDLDSSVLGQLWRQSLRDQKPVSLEHFYTWPSGRQAWIEMRAFPANGGLAIFFRDVSDRKKAQDELQRAQGELIHASRLSAMGAMAATLAHELSQPLTAVSNYIEATARMLRRLPTDEVESATEALGYAAAATERSREILKRLRRFVARRPIDTATHDIASIIADATVLILPQAQSEGVEIEYRLDPGARWVEADAIQVQQVLINLVRNAIEAMHSADESRVTISTAPAEEGKIRIQVEDNGPGLGSEPERYFAPFESAKTEGLGLGLSISRTIVEAHGGTIEARSAQSGGALFQFTLKRAERPD